MSASIPDIARLRALCVSPLCATLDVLNSSSPYTLFCQPALLSSAIMRICASALWFMARLPLRCSSSVSSSVSIFALGILEKGSKKSSNEFSFFIRKIKSLRTWFSITYFRFRSTYSPFLNDGGEFLEPDPLGERPNYKKK